MALTLERFVLPILAATFVSVLLLNPGNRFNLGQRVSGGVAIIAIAFFLGFTIESMRAPESRARPGEASASESPIHVLKDDSNKEWLLDRDKVVVLEVIEPKLHFDTEIEISNQFPSGQWTAQVNVTNFEISGINLHDEFRRAWLAGKINFSSENGIFNPFSPQDKLYLPMMSSDGRALRQPIIEFHGLRYTFKKEYYLGNTALLPNSREIDDFQTKMSKRIFTESDLKHFDTQKFRRYEAKEKIPEQGATLHFLMEPSPVDPGSTGEVIDLRINNATHLAKKLIGACCKKDRRRSGLFRNLQIAAFA